jgi:hypothetical protein
MKKMCTLLATVFFVSAAVAQYPQDNCTNTERGRDAGYNDASYRNGHDRDRWREGGRERDMQLLRINREYDRKIAAVKNDWFMGRYRKERIIYSLENQRRNEIRMLYEAFNRSHNRFEEDNHTPGRHW